MREKPETHARAHPAWTLVEAALAAGLSAVSVFAIARLIGPAELGIGAAAVAVNVLLWVTVNALFADPLTQSATTDPREISAIFWASAGMGALAALLQAASGPLLARALDDPRLIPMCLALAAPLPLVGAAGAIQGLLTRARRYDLLATRAALGQGLGTVIGIILAFQGAGGWALVAQQCATAAIGALVLLLRARWRPIWSWRWSWVRPMLAQGMPLIASTLVQLARYRIFVLLVGGMLGPAALGQLHLAFRLVDTVRELIAAALWRLLLPAMAEHRDDPRATMAAIDGHLGLYGAVLFPLCGLLLLGLVPLVQLLLGPAWVPSAEAAPPLIALLAWAILAFAANVAAITRGAAPLVMLTHLAALGLTLLGALLLQPETPFQAIWIWTGAQALALPWLVWRVATLLQSPASRLFQAGLPALAATGLATLLAFWLPLLWGEPAGPLSLLLQRGGLFALVYLPIAARLLRGLAWRPARALGVADAAR